VGSQIRASGFLNNRNHNIPNCLGRAKVNGFSILVLLVTPECHRYGINVPVRIRQVASFIWRHATPADRSYFINIAAGVNEANLSGR
ncbi:7807_t:CDS:1, partial [Racocetra persica]